jgi:hypothetical protein
MNSKMARRVCALVLGACGTIAVAAAAQQPSAPAITSPGIGNPAYRQETHFTFDGPVQLPGITLPAGEYVFHLADPADGRNVVHVTSADGKKDYGNFNTKVVSRDEKSNTPELTFLETPANMAPAVKGYFFPGQSNGREFVYSKEQEDRIAGRTSSDTSQSAQAAAAPASSASATTGTTAGTTAAANEPSANRDVNADNTSSTAASAATAPSRSTSTVARADQSANQPVGTSGVEPSARADASAAAQTPSSSTQTASPANQSQTQTGANGAATRDELPRTASPLPLIALLGGVMLGAAGAVRMWRRAQA